MILPMMLLRDGVLVACGDFATVVDVEAGIEVGDDVVEVDGEVVEVELESTATVVVVDSAAALSHAAANASDAMTVTATERTSGLGIDTFQSFKQRIPRESCTLDAHRELHDTLQCFEVSKIH